ncbi:MAG TPA: neuraminidase-like domain-containing protein, partial [Agriterribacter sp.]|nr:neuraminidase-like domain-containing protein [Agriterribacter sp.]
DTIPGEGEEQLQNYALLMEKSIMSAFPTQHVAANIVKSDQYQNTELPKFFEIAPDFSFNGTNIASYVNKLNGKISNKAAVIKDLSKLQRLFYLAPVHDRYNVMDVLDKEGLGSALQIRQFGKNAFLNIFGKKLGNNFLAALVFNKASAISATTMNLALQYNDLGSNILPYVLQGKKGKNKKSDELDLPDLSSLFGAQSFCSCEYCRSVYSAAAYFVDLLSFLKETYQIDTAASTDDDIVYVEISPNVFVNGLELLFNRRSDLGDILLNCENTNTVIPYLDIVIEVLENAVLNASEAYQTTSTSDELKANPEHIKTEVYDEHLAKEIFPFTQPFNLWNEEGHVYMEHLGILRYEMMETFQFRGNANEPDDQSKHAVQLNLTANGKSIITGKTVIGTTTYTTKDFWGMTAPNWIERLSKVRKFIDKVAISYEQLLEFLQLKFVNATGTIKVQFAPDAPCDIDQAVLAYWDDNSQSFTSQSIHEKAFIRTHCFFRLLEKTPWTIFELGRIMDSLGVQNIKEQFIEQAAILLQLQSKFKKEPLEILSWWADLNTQSDENNPDDRSFYARHFLNKAVFDPKEINEESFVFALNDDGTELKNPGNHIGEYLNEIEAALNITSSDLLLLAETLVTSGGEIDDALTRKNLSQLFRIVSLCKTLRISITEYLIAKDFIAADPFNADKATELLSFIDQVEQVKRSGFIFNELQYLLLDQYNSAEGIAPTEDRIITLFTSLQEGLQKIKAELEVPVDENGMPVDPTGALCKQKASMLLEEEGIGYVVSIAESASPLTPEQETNAPTYLFFLDANQLIVDFATAAYSGMEARYAYILQRLTTYLVVTQSRSFIIQAQSTDLSVDLDMGELLLTQLVYSTGSVHDPNNPIFAIEDFLDPLFAYDMLEEGEKFDLDKFSIQKNTYLVLYKSALVSNKFNLTAEEASWTFSNGSAIGWLDLNAITGTPDAVFSSWLKMENFFYMRSRFAEGNTTFFELMEYAATPSLIEDMETGYEEAVDDFIATSSEWTDADKDFLIFLSLLSEVTGWETDSLFYLCSSEAYMLNFVDFKDEQAFYQLMKCFDVLNTLGASAVDSWEWMAVDLSAENSANIKQTAKAKYSETEWLKVAAPLRDVLREKQRDALNAYLIQNRGFEDEDALYAFYLLDVETSACTMSSRIVLANSSVQLFIQRHLMNLEAETLDLDADRWEWMKNYRVWEANRKVFLYPENWIEPDLRLTKSEFFTDLQNALLQNDVTADLVETSIKDYLEKLDEISNIEVCGTYHQYEEGDGITVDTIDVLHVFGKTSGVPNEYYYRTYVDNNYWTPWTKVNLDIQDEHLLPIVLNNRLYLFWPEFIATTESVIDILTRDLVTNVTGDPDFEATINYYDINLAYSEYKDGNWLAKKISKEKINSNRILVATDLINGYATDDVLPSICFHTEQKENWLEIECIQKIDYQAADLIIWGIQGRFTFLYDKKEVIINEDDGVETLMEPPGTAIYFNSFREINSSKLQLITADVDANNNYLSNENYVEVLEGTPGTFRLPMPHQYNEFVSQDNFFYGDDYRNFFVKPYHSFTKYTDDLHPTYSSDETSFSLDHYLNEADIAVGTFHETTYDTHGIEEVIFDSGPLDQIDPIPPHSIGRNTTMSVRKKAIIQKKSSVQLLSKTTNPVLDGNIMNEQVGQLQYAGSKKYRFHNFYHPYINDFIKTLNLDGVEDVLTREMQQQLMEYFDDLYLPTENVHTDYPVKEVDFSPEGAMSFYNWELFFHIPMLIAERLSNNQQFEDAQKWYHFIFNPLDRSSEASPNKFWQFKPFFELYGEGEGAAEDSIYNLLYALSYTGTDADTLNKKAEVEQQIDIWLASPFDPHAIAALRPVAYMKSIVMKYIDNLVAWGDFKFQQDTIESINEATQVYILAAQILGRRPELIPVEETEVRSYNDLIDEAGTLDSFSNALVTMENFYNSESLSVSSSAEAELLPKSLYFCIPNNPNLLAYWDTVEDRLFKIRHCMNIEGVVRQLPLFQPPIDPGLLVKARAAGLSIGSVLNDLYAPLPNYRYRVMVQKAIEFCADVKVLGNTLLSVLEKKDAEEMALLRAGHELKLLQAMSDTKKMQLDEAKENLSALQATRKITEARYDYYVNIEKINTKEQLYLDKLEESRNQQKTAEKYEMGASIQHTIPDASASITAGVPPKVSIGASFGGSNLGAVASAIAAAHRNKSGRFSYEANKASILAGYNRRWDDWKL